MRIEKEEKKQMKSERTNERVREIKTCDKTSVVEIM